jgi:SAM-dependent methyltransferase
MKIMGQKALERTGKAWADHYSRHLKTDWEKIPLDDLANFVESSGVRKKDVKTVLDIGCGRGFRDIVLATRCFNRSEVKMFGVDVAKHAIDDAKTCLQEIIEGNICERLANYLPKACRLQCTLTFEVANFLHSLPWSNPASFDLVIDWMCFHEVRPIFRKQYIEKVNNITKNYYILCAFSKERNTQKQLQPVVKNVEKYQFSEDDIKHLFSEFSIVNICQYEECFEPPEPHTNGIVAAKRAYLMLKK